MRNIVLIGMPGSGKSTVGVLLAKALQLDFADTDLLIQSRYGTDLSSLIAHYGNEGFIKIENDVIASADFKNCVVATGGSAVYGDGAMRKLGADGVIVYLKLGNREIESRIGNLETRGIVMRKGTDIKSVFEDRAELYERYADVTVVCSGMTPEQTARAVAAAVSEKLGTRLECRGI